MPCLTSVTLIKAVFRKLADPIATRDDSEFKNICLGDYELVINRLKKCRRERAITKEHTRDAAPDKTISLLV